ncbi:prolyl oligopeptidase family serine peptidase [Flavobacterium sp.]|uniref:carboxylesterase family protein n=1 Tax=Flavobacterium sp. TaxID=239 RepID=UPI00391D7784
MKKKSKIIVLLFFLGLSLIGFAQETSGSYFSTQICENYSYGYLLHKPKVVKTKKPLIVFLHGSGEKGTDLEKLKIHGPLKYIKNNKLDAFILAPQCALNANWEAESLYQLIQKICKENNIDTRRIYLTGLSLGGWGTWDLALAHPELFAALVPIAGFVNVVQEDSLCKLKDIPTKIFHGLLDDSVDFNYAATAYEKLKACNTNVKLTIFDDANHDSWSRVYDTKEIYDWMLQQVKK